MSLPNLFSTLYYPGATLTSLRLVAESFRADEVAKFTLDVRVFVSISAFSGE